MDVVGHGQPEGDGRSLPVLSRAAGPAYGTGGELPALVEARQVRQAAPVARA